VTTNDSMTHPALENLLDKVDSKFSLVTLAARRSRQLQDYYLGVTSSKTIPPQVPSLRKLLSLSFEEISAGKIVRITGDEVREREAAELAALADAQALELALLTDGDAAEGDDA
jgi:DNA-directed RNA polymerase subunit omega